MIKTVYHVKLQFEAVNDNKNPQLSNIVDSFKEQIASSRAYPSPIIRLNYKLWKMLSAPDYYNLFAEVINADAAKWVEDLMRCCIERNGGKVVVDAE